MAISTSHSAMNRLSDRNEVDTWWGAMRGDNGDLVYMSYLDQVKKFCSPRNYVFKKAAYQGKKGIDLYASGDSYIFLVPDSSFAAVDKYKFSWRAQNSLPYMLDSAKRNVLLIETTERYIRSIFNDTSLMHNVHREEPPKTALNFLSPVKRQVHYAAFPFIPQSLDALFNPNINQNIEFNLFNYNFINPVREAKGAFTYYMFSRASGSVVISDNGQQLFLKETVLKRHSESAYAPIDTAEISKIVFNLNALYRHYKAEGFYEVYLSMIPNPVSILQPGNRYNHLLPLIENDPRLEMKTISVYKDFTTAKQRIFRPGDTHWNNNGMQIWLRKVNERLAAINELP